MPTLKPSEVRDRIVSEHADMLERLAALDVTLSELRCGRASWQSAVSECHSLYDALIAHIDMEDELLVPALRDIDAWGSVRADMLTQHHVAQRQELRAVLGDNGESDQRVLATRVGRLIDDLLTDMAHEEREVLARDLLRDDVIAIALEDG